MKNILIEIYDRKEQFLSTYDNTTTPMKLAQLIQDANYYEYFNLSEIFYFKIKYTQYYFANRNTPIYKYLNNIDNPTLIFYKGLSGQQLLESSKGIDISKAYDEITKINNEVFKIYNDKKINVQQQKDIQNGKELYNIQQTKQFEQTSQQQSQQSNKKKITIFEISSEYNHLNQDQQNLRQTEGVNYTSAYSSSQQPNNIQQKVQDKFPNSFDASRQFSGTVKTEIIQQNSFIRPSFDQSLKQQQQQQQNNQQIKKDQYKISFDASSEQYIEICKFLKNNNINFQKLN